MSSTSYNPTCNHTLLGLKAASKSKSISNRQASDRQRDCLVLILAFLRQFGYVQTAAQLQSEGGSIISKFQVADNIDLIRILTEYEDYCEIKFKRKPKFSRQLLPNGDKTDSGSGNVRTVGIINKPLLPPKNTKFTSQQQQPQQHQNAFHTKNLAKDGKDSILTPMEIGNTLHIQGQKELDKELNLNNNYEHHQEAHSKIIKPLPTFGDNLELRGLAASLQSEILDSSPEVYFDNIIALDNAKRLLKEAVVIPMKYPDLFNGILVPWRGVLLYGPPGTGKTLLAKAVATETQTAFFNISASSIVSKFRGESEKLIKVLFELARYHSPSTIFIDEIDSIMGQRGCGSSAGSGEHEHEGSRRMKTELLIELDGLNNNNGEQHIFLLAASNMPWDLDQALLRRLEKRILVPMPDEIARKKLLKLCLSHHVCHLHERDFDECAKKTIGYNSADIKLLCKECAMKPIRLIYEKLESSNIEDMSLSQGKRKSSDIKTLLKKYPIVADDLRKSLEMTKPSTDPSLYKRHMDWADSYGSN